MIKYIVEYINKLTSYIGCDFNPKVLPMHHARIMPQNYSRIVAKKTILGTGQVAHSSIGLIVA